ncbi:mucin-5AC isoform X1 [Drosophila pseudoobscura]|uniref:Mucin-5AC isoform X1 n=1 Tax=Drosophila pseudoobscura pseudoobscura TaxID=46245 RepID=A0A6I8VM79_DROPS|nr:mucin-5AC isoform X1 [Drosophila pseudoobscura]
MGVEFLQLGPNKLAKLPLQMRSYHAQALRGFDLNRQRSGYGGLFSYLAFVCMNGRACSLKEELKMLQPRITRMVKYFEDNFNTLKPDCSTNMYAKQPDSISQKFHILSKDKILSLTLLATFFLSIVQFGAAQTVDEPYVVNPTPTLPVVGADDVTTVLFVNNGAGRVGDSHGRFLTVRPEVGLLTSTARTFIQDGITTEFATQVVGTTLNNGRIYAQYLKKSSRVVYENDRVVPSVVTSWVGGGGDYLKTRSFLQNHNDLFNADAPDWQDIDDNIGVHRGEFVGNTDFVNLQNARGTVLQTMEAESYLDNISSSSLQLIQISSNTAILQSDLKAEGRAKNFSAENVLSGGYLPTITVKNYFQHSVFQPIAGVKITDRDSSESSAANMDDGRFPKAYYQQQQQSGAKIENSLSKATALPATKRMLATVTYYGFADFTTIVGDSVIVFSPSTIQSSQNYGHVTSIKGKPTLRTESSNVSDAMISEQMPILSTAINQWNFGLDTTRIRSDSSNIVDETNNSNQFSTPEIKIAPNLNYDTNFTSVQALSSQSTTTEIIHMNTGDLLESIADHKNTVQSTAIVKSDDTLLDESSPQVHGGATTVFIDDDPFANFVVPTGVSHPAQSSTDQIDHETITENSEDADETTVSIEEDQENTPKTEAATENLTEDLYDNPLTEPLPPLPTNDNNNTISETCDHTTSQVFLTQLTKSLGYLNTGKEDPSSASSDENPLSAYDIVQTTKYYCIQATQVQQLEKPEIEFLSVVSEDAATELISTELSNKIEESTVHETVDFDVTTDNEYDSEDDDYDTDNGSNEVDLIYKTLYTTYTYLTTFFQGTSTTVSSHTEIVTNLISSTAGTEVDTITKPTDTIATFGGFGLDTASMSQQTESKASALASKYTIPQEIVSLLQTEREEKSVVDESKNKQQTEYLNDSKYTNTLFTTYTYYTSIFADNDTDIMSRTEVVTNYITKNSLNNYLTDTPTYLDTKNAAQNLQASSQVKFKPAEDRVEKEEHVTLVMDVRSISVNGNQQVILNQKDPVDDQVSSESNTDEIIPSATLLLQTSFTTFTFYTTMYVGDVINVISRLETVTNVATETLKPTKMFGAEEATFPVTYFTTFTYWTKLAKDGEITTLSREETLSNVIEPTNLASIPEDETLRTAANSYSSLDPSDDGNQHLRITDTDTESIVTSGMTNTSLRSDLTTYYTTYTYYTTSYEVNETITKSRFETVTNVVTPTDVTTSTAETILKTPAIAQPSELLTTSLNNIINSTSALVLFDYKHIVDADEVSTLYFTTEVASAIDSEGIEIEITSSTSSLHVDEMKKSSLAIMILNDDSLSSSKPFKTGLVRLIEGTRIGNGTTTLYQSKVIGTVIDNRYAQIIESTSSFLFEKKTEDAALLPTSVIVSAMPSQTGNLHVNADSNIEQEDEPTTTGDIDDENRSKALDPSQTSKRTFAPVIRPFASRNRPNFAPKQKTLSPSSATIITRSDITPTITATPALKTSGRYSSSRRGVISNAPINQNELGFPQSSRRTFGRPIKSSSSSVLNELGVSPQSNAAFVPPRNRFASSPRPTQTVTSRKQNINASYRPSNSPGFRASGILVGNSKFRVKPTVSGSSANERTTTKTVSKEFSSDSSVEDDNSTDELVQISDEEESTRRNQNPLLRLRRPINRPSGFAPVPRSSVNSSAVISLRRNPLSARAKTTSTTTTTTTTAKPRTRSFQRPTISSLQARSRPQNSLFPPRGLFQTQQRDENQKEIKKNENESENISEYDDDDDADDDGEDDVLDEVNRSRRSNSKSQKGKSLSRVRRQADAFNRSRFRFRRPNLSTMSPLEDPSISNTDDLNETTASSRVKTNSRFGSRFPSPRGQQAHSQKSQPSSSAVANHRTIRPTRPTTPRTQFTLREKDATLNGAKRSGTPSNFRRQPSTGSPSIRRTIGTGTGTSRRLKSYSGPNVNNNADNGRLVGTSRSRNGNSNGLNRGRGSVRGRNRNEYVPDLQIIEMGSQTITVTHLIPAEVTVPVINGQITEYKNIVTAKTSTEVLGPNQYTEILGTNGQTSKYLTREESSINNAGVTELTRYLLHDSLTTTVTFTPTTIRGRKTSFSHILPSTVYSVEHLVSTVQPQISANAPLANILLSQLLLGNLNLPANPLIGALGQQQSAISAIVSTSVEPVTEYRTHTSTYVTTIFDGKSTILPLTFQGKKILTTVYDTTAQTITATEYSVDTIVNTPIIPQNVKSHGPAAQVNSLLLQQLLLQQQQEPFSVPQGLSHTQSPQLLLSENLQDLDDAARTATQVDDIDDEIVTINSEMQTTKINRKKSRKTSKGHKRSKQQKLDNPLEDTSVVTLYVSGRRPGEFSTVLSTVQNGYDHSAALQKRQAHSQIRQTVTLGEKEVNDMYDTEESRNVILFISPKQDHPQLDKNTLDTFFDIYHGVGSTEVFGDNVKGRTASLESIVGDVDLWYSKSSSQSMILDSKTDSVAIDKSNFNFLA